MMRRKSCDGDGLSSGGGVYEGAVSSAEDGVETWRFEGDRAAMSTEGKESPRRSVENQT